MVTESPRADRKFRVAVLGATGAVGRKMLEVLAACPALRNTADGYSPRPEMRPLTKFEARGLRLGHGVWDLVFERR